MYIVLGRIYHCPYALQNPWKVSTVVQKLLLILYRKSNANGQALSANENMAYSVGRTIRSQIQSEVKNLLSLYAESIAEVEHAIKLSWDDSRVKI